MMREADGIEGGQDRRPISGGSSTRVRQPRLALFEYMLGNLDWSTRAAAT